MITSEYDVINCYLILNIMRLTLFNSTDYIGNSYSRISGKSLFNLDDIYTKQDDVSPAIDAYTKSKTDALSVPIKNMLLMFQA